MVTERHLARNPQLPALSRKLARAKVYEFSLDNLASRLQIKVGLKYAYKLLLSNPAALRKLALERWPRGLVRRLSGAIRHRLGYPPVQHIGPLFLSLDPKDVGPDDLWQERRTLFEKLSALNSAGLGAAKQKTPPAGNSIAKLRRTG
jgi:hypothetical protein